MNDVAKLAPAELGGIVGSNADDPHTEAWEHAGLACAILRSPMQGMNGYVQLPEQFRGRRLRDEDVDVEAHGGLTYGMDAGGWVGFDTGHAWDHWLDPDLPESDQERLMREVRERDPQMMAIQARQLERAMRDPWTMIWTKEKLKAEVERVAENIMEWCAAHPDACSTETPAEHQERIRLVMREAHRLHREQGVPLTVAWRRASAMYPEPSNTRPDP